MLVVDNVTKGFGNFIALTDLSFELGNGVYGLLAPNGAGKTTLIKMLATLLFPTKGSIRFEGKDIIAMGEEYRDLIGYLPQQFGFYKNDSPTDYLHYIAALKGLTKKEANQKIPELLELVALTEVAKKKMKKFSGGMIQRVGIAQALLNDPKILILDEPTAGLDPKERARFRNLLSQLSRDRIVLLSTHIVADVESIANEIIMIKDTKILYKESIGFLCNQLAGEIYETTLTFDELEVFKKTHLVLGEKQASGNIIVKFQSKNEPIDTWKPVDPQLEDVFLTIYRDDQS